MHRLLPLILLTLVAATPALAQDCEEFEILAAGNLPENGYEPERGCNFTNDCTDQDLWFTNQARFDAFWADFMDFMIDPPAPPAPTVDFTEDIVVVVALGHRFNMGHGIGITCVSYHDEWDPIIAPNADLLVRIEATESDAGPHCNTHPTVNKPYIIAKVSKQNELVLAVDFDHQIYSYDCEPECFEPCCTGCPPNPEDCPPVCPGGSGNQHPG